MGANNALETAKAWQNAANTRDVPRLLEVSDPEIEIVGPRGLASGHQILQDWVSRAGLRVTSLRTFMKGDTAVIAGHGEWRSVETGEIQGEAEIASHFVVRSGKVTRIARYNDLNEALEKAGLHASDEVS